VDPSPHRHPRQREGRPQGKLRILSGRIGRNPSASHQRRRTGSQQVHKEGSRPIARLRRQENGSLQPLGTLHIHSPAHQPGPPEELAPPHRQGRAGRVSMWPPKRRRPPHNLRMPNVHGSKKGTHRRKEVLRRARQTGLEKRGKRGGSI